MSLETFMHPSAISLPMFALIVIVVLPISAVLGWVCGMSVQKERDHHETQHHAYPNEAAMGALLALLGLLLAFSFSFSLDRFEARKAAQIDEATALGTAFLRADILPEPGRTQLQQTLVDYAGTRVIDTTLMSRERMTTLVQGSMAAQARIWPAMLRAIAAPTPPEVAVNVMNGITEMLDAHTARLAAGADSVPAIAKIMVLLCASAALFVVGNAAGLRGHNLTWRAYVFAGVLALTMIVILDFERPREGFVRLDTRIMQITVAEMAAALEANAAQ